MQTWLNRWDGRGLITLVGWALVSVTGPLLLWVGPRWSHSTLEPSFWLPWLYAGWLGGILAAWPVVAWINRHQSQAERIKRLKVAGVVQGLLYVPLFLLWTVGLARYPIFASLSHELARIPGRVAFILLAAVTSGSALLTGHMTAMVFKERGGHS